MVHELHHSQARSTVTVPGGRLLSIPPGVDQAEVDSLGLGVTAIFSVNQQLQAPRSPGPTVDFFVADGSIDIASNLQMFDVGHPERANPGFLNPASLPPNNADVPALGTIPMDNFIEELAALDDLFRLDSDYICLEPKHGDVCLDPTSRYCVDSSHQAESRIGVCDECHVASRARFEPRLAGLIFNLRAYACSPCAAQATNVDIYQGKRLRVWGLPVPDPAASVPDASPGQGPPLRLTGCACATKLLDRRLCTAHRLEHFFEVREKAQNIKNYVRETWGRMICGFCLDRVGTDSYLFQGDEGRQGQGQVYLCLACHGVVIADDLTHHAMTQEATAIIQGETLFIDPDLLMP
jgi:hypothetical protein